MKIIIYTANIGDYDKEVFLKNMDFPFYKISCHKHKNPRLFAREIKLKPHEFLPDHDYSIWIDSNIEILNHKFDFNYDIVTWKHPERNCVYDEAQECIRLKKDNPDIIYKQMQKYRLENYPEQNGMLASGFMVRKNTEHVRNFCEDWWKELKENSIRDQLSFNYIAYKYNLNILYRTTYEGFRKLSHKRHK